MSTICLWDLFLFYLHFSGKKTEAPKDNLPKVTKLISRGARIQIQAV